MIMRFSTPIYAIPFAGSMTDISAVFPYRDGYLMRVSYEKGVVGVLLKERMDVEGRRVEIEGEFTEYPFIKPSNITLLD